LAVVLNVDSTILLELARPTKNLRYHNTYTWKAVIRWVIPGK
jgi:hypothetical protein